MNHQTKPPPASGALRWKWLSALFLVGVLGGVAIYFKLPSALHELLKQALHEITRLGAWAPVLYILLYIVCCVAFIPGSILTLGGGAAFGLVKGSIYVSIAATLGATAAFLVGRYLARDWIVRKMAGHPKFAAIDRAVAEEGWKTVLLVRLCPIFPFVLMNYAFGLTRVSLRHYVLATWVGMLPAGTLFVYLGSLANPDESQSSPLGWMFKGLGLIATILFTVYLTRVARGALAKRISD